MGFTFDSDRYGEDRVHIWNYNFDSRKYISVVCIYSSEGHLVDEGAILWIDDLDHELNTRSVLDLQILIKILAT